MPALRYFRCGRCDRVYSDVETPPWCPACDGGHFDELTPSREEAAYFAPQ